MPDNNELLKTLRAVIQEEMQSVRKGIRSIVQEELKPVNERLERLEQGQREIGKDVKYLHKDVATIKKEVRAV